MFESELSESSEQSLPPKTSFVDTDVKPVKEVKLGSPTRDVRIEEAFLKFCSETLELPEREGELPEDYSRLSLEELQNIISSLNDVKVRVDTSNSNLSDKTLETMRVKEAVESVKSHDNRSAIIYSEKDLSNPLGEVDNATLLLFADFHHAPTDVKSGIRAEVFRRYGLQRKVSRLPDWLAQRKRFKEIKDNLLGSNVVKRYIIREDVRCLFRRWMTDLIVKRFYTEKKIKDTQNTPIIVSLGDHVHDGAFLIDQLDINTGFRQILDEISNRQPDLDPKLLELNGNHDQDSRIPESFSMLTTLYGHRIFTQEIDGGILVAAVDTNIENPEWVRQFQKRAGEEEMQLFKFRKQLQEKVLRKIQAHNGPVLLMGHNPSRIIDAFAVKRPVIQNSNVQVIIGGHTHQESHVLLPFKNKEGKSITMHVIESTARLKGNKPQAPKLYAIDIRDGQIGLMRTMCESQGRFERRYEDYTGLI